MNQIWLSIDLSTPRGSFALHTTADRMICEVQFEAMRSSEQLLGRLEETLRVQNLRFESINRLLTGSGPGSFTGLRIALATLKGFALARGIPIETMSGAEAQARAWRRISGKANHQITVLTQTAADSLVVSRFDLKNGDSNETVESKKTWRPVAGELVLGEISPTSGPKPESEPIPFPLRARYLAEEIDRSLTRQSYPSPQDQISLVPRYFGTARFTASAATTTR